MLVGIVTMLVSVLAVLNHQLIWLLAIFPGLYILYAFTIAFSKAPVLKDTIKLTASEQDAWAQHHTFLRYPSAAVGMAGTISILQFISVILAAALFLSGLSWGIFFALFWMLGILTPRLNPTTTYLPAAQNGDLRALERMQSISSLREKLDNR